ncbi:nucleotidyl transferase AbiEii/AbiGii toxin family protein [Phyllobacterium chamaecytisi]|uniref:nucleotidyl transferase AbiEii/AbiGii toxin family protein n=1 Tax=Phyllobacterium chamaecytisi TaxID=2876082 RepID=UPI001CCF0FA3|nr:nucleotidyl transferase AbiEii/AbiGii toxin family protein [Phyllobacterium sp. KW56]MBZ9603337.1 nucleotidyl transferase AbiEii/AbiGii toxin family protein [Phyllobacterium sp. KW56]
MPHEPRNVGASVRARLLDRARAERSDFQILLTRYAIERLLYRLSVSPHRDRFVLKGAMLFVTWVADPFRPTRDLDLLGQGDDDAEAIAETFRAICAQPVADDGVTFDVAALTAASIREEVEYGGVRVRTTATIAGARIPIQVDIGFGDAITPAAIEIDYPVLLDSPTPKLRAYPVETVVAEKFEALVTLGIANSRLKDFYDLWVISRTFELRRAALVVAVQRTFERRRTVLPSDIPVGLCDEFAEARAAQWRAFLGRERLAGAPGTFAAIIADLRVFLMPLVVGLEEERFWPPSGPWLPGAAIDEA